MFSDGKLFGMDVFEEKVIMVFFLKMFLVVRRVGSGFKVDFWIVE